MLGVVRARVLLVVAGLLMGSFGATTGQVQASVAAPVPSAPDAGAGLSDMTVTLSWDLPQGATQYQVQVVPINGDGPGVNLIRNAEGSFTIPAPPAWYILLPDMTYTWRVRATDKPTSAPDDDPAWGPWSEIRSFHTPAVNGDSAQPVSPADGSSLASAKPVTVQWSYPDPKVFYFEVQISRDASFNTDPATATSFVWWVLRHGGVTDPPNSWTTPVDLEASATYHWRVRPRVQGDGAPASWSPTWTFTTPALPRIVFASNRGGHSDIYGIQSDGSGLTTMTSSPASDTFPAMSYDGTRIAFVSNRDGNDEIYAANPGGGGLQRLTDSPGMDTQPAWSPDGYKIAFVSDRDGNRQVYVMTRDGAGVMNLTSHTSFQDEQPVWSPDSSKIAFVSNRTGNKQIFVMNNDGSGQTNLTSGTMVDDEQPAWSPDGTRIAFVSNRSGNQDIFVMNADGSGQRALTTNPTSDTYPAWSPDGSAIAFTSDRDGNREIYLMRSDGSGQANRSTNGADDWRPVWSVR